MKYIFLVLMAIGFNSTFAAMSFTIYARLRSSLNDTSKIVLDSTAIRHWVGLGDSRSLSISNDGLFCAYLVNNKPYKHSTLVIQSTIGQWKEEFIDASPGSFLKDNVNYIFLNRDSLCFLKIGEKGEIQKKSDVIDYQLCDRGNSNWIAYQLKNNDNDLVLYNFETKKEIRYKNTLSYSFSINGAFLILTQLIDEEERLQRINLAN